MLSIYVNGESDIPDNVLDAINSMQAVFGIRGRYTADLDEMRQFIAENSGQEIADQVKADYFLHPQAL